MRILLTSDDYYEKSAIRACIRAAQARLRTEGIMLCHETIQLRVYAKPRIKRLRALARRDGTLTLSLPKQHAKLQREQIAQYLAWALAAFFFDGAPFRQATLARLYHTDFPDLRMPLPRKQKPAKLKGPDVALEKCLAEVGRAQARVVSLQKQLARAERHLAKKQLEARKRERALTKPLAPGDKLSDNQLAARLRVQRQHAPQDS